MIIYGTRAVHLKSAQAQSTTCAHCGQTNTTVLSIFSKHAHIFWVPLFPIGKVGQSHCTHCKQTLEYKDMSRELQIQYNHLKGVSKTPVWQFAGLVLIAGLIGLAAYTSGQDEKNRLEYVANPKAGDIYKYKTEDKKNYSTLKVVSVSDDSVFVSPNNYQTDKMSGVYKIDKAENYPDITYGIARSDIKQMLQDDEIYDIDRN